MNAKQEYSFSHGLTALVDLLQYGILRSHSGMSHSVWLLWTSDGPSQGPLPDNTKQSQETDIHANAVTVSERQQTHALNRAWGREQGDIKILLNCRYS